MALLALVACSLLDVAGATCSAYPNVTVFEGTGQEDCRHYEVVIAVDSARLPLVERTCEPEEVRDALSDMEGNP